MNTHANESEMAPKQAPKWLQVTLYLQLGIALFAIAVAIAAALGAKPLIEERSALVKQNAQLRTEAQATQAQLAKYREALNAARDGINAYHAGNYSGAISSYDSALQAAPNDPYLLDLKGYSQFKAHDFQSATITLKKAVEADPNFAWGYFDLARTYCGSKEYANAAKALATARDKGIPDEKIRRDVEFTHLCAPLLRPAAVSH